MSYDTDYKKEKSVTDSESLAVFTLFNLNYI